MSCSTARAGSLERNAWSVICASVALSDGRLQHAVELGLLPPLRRRLQRAGALLQSLRQPQRLLHGGRVRRGRIGREVAEQGREGVWGVHRGCPGGWQGGRNRSS